MGIVVLFAAVPPPLCSAMEGPHQERVDSFVWVAFPSLLLFLSSPARRGMGGHRNAPIDQSIRPDAGLGLCPSAGQKAVPEQTWHFTRAGLAQPPGTRDTGCVHVTRRHPRATDWPAFMVPLGGPCLTVGLGAETSLSPQVSHREGARSLAQAGTTGGGAPWQWRAGCPQSPQRPGGPEQQPSKCQD